MSLDAEPRGLDQAQAEQRLRDEGANTLPQAPRRTLSRIALEVAGEPMFLLLLAATGVHLLLGERGEALMLLSFVLMIVGISLVQEHRTERVLEALRDLTSPRAVVIRSGLRQRIAGREVVRGDLLVLEDGDRVAADAWLISAHDLMTDESLLTGEAVPVRKLASATEPPPARPGGDNLALVFAGTVVVGGQGLARVLATGARSEIGRIGKSLGSVQSPPTPLKLEIRRLVRIFSVLGLALSLLLVLLHGLLRGDWLAGLLGGITLAMSMLPQEFLLILTVFTAMGAWRMSRQRVLTRRAATLETLGSATVLCTDKTGTLTQNHMQVAELAAPAEAGARRWVAGGEPLPEAMHKLLRHAMLAGEREATDPMEKAIQALALAELGSGADTAGWVLAHEYSLSPALLAMTHLWRVPGEAGHLAAVKGAPEAVLMLCPALQGRTGPWLEQARAMAARGLRVLGVGRARFTGEAWPASQREFDFEFLGLVAMADPLRESVPAAVRECRAAGLRVVMITGDFAATAQAVARQAGLDAGTEALSGAQVAALDEAGLREQVRTCNVFARVLPEQKLRIVEALKANGQIVAMTGDGVNDAPSLKAAHIGIAMGQRGTDVAREAAALVLLDDDFGSIVRAVRMGRHIHDNLRKAMAYVLAVHVPIAGLALLPVLLGWPPVFMPAHIAFLELVISPVSSFVFEAEAEESDLMQRPPRAPDAPMFAPSLIGWSLAQGLLILLGLAISFGAMVGAGVDAGTARATSFIALVVASFGLVVVNRSLRASLLNALRQPSGALTRIMLVTGALLACALGVPVLRDLFHFTLPGMAQFAAALGLGLLLTLGVDRIKRLALSAGLPAWLRLTA